jgi:nitric oxide reductase activation protein
MPHGGDIRYRDSVQNVPDVTSPAVIMSREHGIHPFQLTLSKYHTSIHTDFTVPVC